MRLSTQNKLIAVQKVIKDTQPVASVAQEFGVARKTIYAWVAAYQSAGSRAKATSLSGHFIKGKAHPRAYRWKLKQALIREVTRDPKRSASRLSKKLKVGRHAIVNLLSELDLSTRQERENFARLYNAPGRLHLDIKRQVVREILEENKSITAVCAQWHLARKTVHNWINRYKSDMNLNLQYRRGFTHQRAYPQKTHKKILAAVMVRPKASIHALAKSLSLSSHGVWNVLKQHHLSHIHARVAYSQAELERTSAIPNLFGINRIKSMVEAFTPQKAPAPPLAADYLVPPPVPVSEVTPQYTKKAFLIILLKLLIKGLSSVFKLPFKLKNPYQSLVISFSIPVILSVTVLGIANYISIFITAPSLGANIGYISASFALLFGFLFFVYSLKYYLSIALVLNFSRHMLLKSQGEIRSLDRSDTPLSGLVSDLSHITLERKPFVSIHLPMYNEKRVVNRLLEAITSVDYENYEVIVCDDSTDETKDLVLDWKNHPRVKISHRDNRDGYKGRALDKAIDLMDKRTEFVMIFDADFLPFPDSVEQFLKYFQETVGSLEQDKYSKSKIAAVQGYQWHVLNKSENWITRGVRAEYAGSYVVERSSAEIYGGLKQISGSVYLIRADVLRGYRWGDSITEDFELTLRLYRDGFKVVYTPYVQAPSECVSTLKRLIRQRMRWAEGHSQNVRRFFISVLSSDKNSFAEKFEFLYLSPYYLQSFFFLLGTLFWFASEAIFQVRLPFWTQVWGWSLVLTNILSLPLMNLVGMFLEEAEEKDYAGLFSFIALTYTIAPFQAYAALKGFFEAAEGPWFRTPKTGKITDTYKKGKFYNWVKGLFGSRSTVSANHTLSLQSRSFTTVQQASLAFILNFSSAPKRKRIANTALSIMLTITLFILSLAPFVSSKPVEAQERSFASMASNKANPQPTPVDSPQMVQFPIKDGNTLEYIFHTEPRTRTKFAGYEIDTQLISADGLGQARADAVQKQNGSFVYADVFPNVDAILTPSVEKLSEELIFNTFADFNSIEYQIKVVDLELAVRDNTVFFAPKNGGNPLFTFTAPFMYEKDHPENKHTGITYELKKELVGWTLSKKLTDEGKRWLSDPKRVFPVVLDPTQITSTIHTAIATGEADYGQQQRKIIWANGALNGDAWYAVYQDASNIFYEKCVPSVDGCETGTDWTDRTDIGGADGDNNNPSAWWEADRAKMWVVWTDNSADNLQFVDIDVDATDPGSAGTTCTGADQANHNPTTWQTNITVDSSDTIYVSYVDTSTSSTNNMYKIATGGCTFSAILTSSGVDASDRPILLATGSQTLHAIFQDGTTLRHSVYVNDGSPGWDSADTDITGAAADNTTTNYSAATDGTDIWLIADQGTGGVDLWTCAACAASASWTDAADPWSSQGTDITEASLSYDSGTDDIIAVALRGSGSSEEVIATGTDTSSISWTSEINLGVFGGGASGLAHLSSTMGANTIDGVALVVWDGTNSELEFSTLPENIWLLLLSLPIFYKTVMNKKRKK